MANDLKSLSEAYEHVKSNSKSVNELIDGIKAKYEKEQYPFDSFIGAIRGYAGSMKGVDGTLREFLEYFNK